MEYMRKLFVVYNLEKNFEIFRISRSGKKMIWIGKEKKWKRI